MWNQHWEREVSQGITPLDALNRCLEEVDELKELVTDDFNERCKDAVFAKEVAGEATDVIITIMGLFHQLGVPALQMIYDKMEVKYTKYPPVVVTDYMALGMPREEAMGKLKEEWKGKGALENGDR